MHVLIMAALLGGPDLKNDGAFGFPQREAVVLCDTQDVRLSAFSDAEHLYVQAIVWKDGDETPGETEDGRAIGDNSTLVIDADADGQATANVDRSYSLNPWPSRPGLNYSVSMGANSSTGLKADSKGRGAISYVESGAGKARVECFLIPLAEIGRKPGEAIKLAHCAHSTTPELTVNSVGYSRDGKRYYAHHLPREKYHDLTLADRPAVIDVQQVPEGRGTIALEAKPAAPMPKVGQVPPPVTAGAWLNWSDKEPPTLQSLRGKVVVVEFWATWCGPCVAGIPHLNELQQGLVILSLTDQSRGPIEKFVQERGMKYVIGVKSPAGEAYGVAGIPHAFVVARDGTLAWHGHPAQPEFDAAIEKALATESN